VCIFSVVSEKQPFIGRKSAFSPFLPQSCLKPTQRVFHWDLWYEIWCENGWLKIRKRKTRHRQKIRGGKRETFIYLHCQAPPSTFCRGRYRNFVDWLIDWLRLENAAPYDKGGKRENYLSDLCDWWSQNYQLGQLQDANSGNNLISFRNLHLAQRQKVHISDISDTSCMCKIYRHIYIYLHLVDDM